ncbi:hypothetical protein FPZ41_46660 [Streptomyces sp. K1PN6]|uniref:Uncharacterized protein n=2 Tax=Streptomyces acidicola TaxID=2596892 RepID=A0A5N8X9I2_9ACTN|nr:hypothetical protein [Streptomyces acidicola]MPY55618.1 hypothetical protein [Streptomyces acidicola]
MGHKGPYLQLRPLSGGRVWDADPDRLEPLTPTELLRVRLAETNARSRQELGIHRPTGDAPPPR